MALKFISFADLLPKTGDGGVRGDATGQANTHAGVAVPLASERASPPPSASGEPGARLNLRGGIDRQQPCGFQAHDPTDPTDPTSSEGVECLPACYCVAPPCSTDTVMASSRVLELNEGHREFSTAMNSDRFDLSLDDSSLVVPDYEIAGCTVDLPVVPVDPLAWKTPADSYHAHHFNCPACIAAGRSPEYGMRCELGLRLWNAYAQPLASDDESIDQTPSNPNAP